MMADKYEGMTLAQIREAKRTERNAENWRGVKVERRRGVSDATLQREAEALAYCREQGHRLRDRGRQACRVCLHESNMGRLGEAGPELPPLPTTADPVCRILDGLLADYGQWGLEELLAKVNEQRATYGRKPYTLTAISIRLRELREHGRTLQHSAQEAGSDTYWYPKPGQPAALVEG
jgi:hypothetical protein